MSVEAVDVRQLINQSALSRWQKRLIALCFIVVALDGVGRCHAKRGNARIAVCRLADGQIQCQPYAGRHLLLRRNRHCNARLFTGTGVWRSAGRLTVITVSPFFYLLPVCCITVAAMLTASGENYGKLSQCGCHPHAFLPGHVCDVSARSATVRHAYATGLGRQ